MLIRTGSGKQKDQIDMMEDPKVQSRVTSHWEDDGDSSVGSVEDYWCIVSEDDVADAPEEFELPEGVSYNEYVAGKRVDEPLAGAKNMDERSSTVKIPALFREQYEKLLKKPHFMLLLAQLVLAVIVIGHLAWDRYAWRNSALLLEKELSNLETTVDGRLILPELKRPVIDLNKAADDIRLPEAWPEEEEPPENVVFDNCWVQAKASFSFGDCASEAKENLKDLSSDVAHKVGKFTKRTWKSALKFKKQVSAAAAKALEPNRKCPEGDTVDSGSEALTSAGAAALDAVGNAAQKVRKAVDGPIHQMAARAKDAIGEATSSTRRAK